MPVGPKVEIGDTLSIAANDKVELTVDVQGLEWMQINRVEIYSHAPGRDSVNGVGNSEWPEGRILQKHDLDPAALPAVVDCAGVLGETTAFGGRAVPVAGVCVDSDGPKTPKANSAPPSSAVARIVRGFEVFNFHPPRAVIWRRAS